MSYTQRAATHFHSLCHPVTFRRGRNASLLFYPALHLSSFLVSLSFFISLSLALGLSSSSCLYRLYSRRTTQQHLLHNSLQFPSSFLVHIIFYPSFVHSLTICPTAQTLPTHHIHLPTIHLHFLTVPPFKMAPLLLLLLLPTTTTTTAPLYN